MKALFFVLFSIILAFGKDDPFLNPNSCKGCHRDQTRLWETSWHSNNNSELYSAVVEIVAQEQNELKAQTLINCSKCHNPHLHLKKINNNYLYSKLFGLRNEKTIQIDEIVENSKKLSGISCYVCHKIDAIDNNKSKVGSELIKWIDDNSTFVGPYKNLAKTIHENAYRAHFENSDQICLTCHNGVPSKDQKGAPNPISAYNTGYEMTSSEKKCVDCHMGTPFEIIVFDKEGRDINKTARPHFFNGAHDILKLKEGFSFSYKAGVLKLKNTTPHMAPTGFGGRLLDINITFINKENKIIAEQIEKIGAKYEKEGKITFQYLADNISFDNRLAPNEERQITLNAPKQAEKIKVVANYYYIDPELVTAHELKLSSSVSDPKQIFSDEFSIK